MRKRKSPLVLKSVMRVTVRRPAAMEVDVEVRAHSHATRAQIEKAAADAAAALPAGAWAYVPAKPRARKVRLPWD